MTEIYVCKSRGKKKAAGTKEAPFKFLWMVLNKVKDGDSVHVSEGRYEGQSKAGMLPKITAKDFALIGGYSEDFSDRNPFKYLTIIGPGKGKQAANGTVIKLNGGNAQTVDGFLIDRGEYSCYSGEGPPGPNNKIEGHKDNSAWGFQAMNRKTSGSCPSIEVMSGGDITVKNNIVVNNPWWGIYVKGGDKCLVENNLVLSFQGRGIECLGAWGKAQFTVRYNTIVFGSCLRSTEGDALMIDPRKNSHSYLIEYNVLAFNEGGGIAQKFKGDEGIEINGNRFFLNRRADYNVGGGTGICNAQDFEDEVEFDAEDNLHELPKFTSAVSKFWLDRWSAGRFVDMLAGEYNNNDEMMATRASVGLNEYHLDGYDQTYAGYTDLPRMRPAYSMSRFPRPMKVGEQLDWEKEVLPLIGMDGEIGIGGMK